MTYKHQQTLPTLFRQLSETHLALIALLGVDVRTTGAGTVPGAGLRESTPGIAPTGWEGHGSGGGTILIVNYYSLLLIVYYL